MSIIRSVSNCVFTNLAYEEHLLSKHFAKTQKPIMFLWQNKPTVVIGRFQNPWLELNVDYARRNEINIARRISGGGTVYHDLGNLNISFIGKRSDYNRKKNLTIICDALREINPAADVEGTKGQLAQLRVNTLVNTLYMPKLQIA